MVAITHASLAPRKQKFLVVSCPLGDLRVMHTVQLWLDGKSIVDFLLAIFSLALTAAALLSKIGQNWRFLKRWVA